MKLVLLICALLLLFPFDAFGGGSGSLVLEHEGQSGFWFPDATATKMLQDLTELPLVRLKVEKLELKLSKQEEYILLLKEDIKITEEISDKWKTAFDEQLKVTETQRAYYEEELKSLRKWYRSPIMWLGIGCLTTTALAIGLNYGLAGAR